MGALLVNLGRESGSHDAPPSVLRQLHQPGKPRRNCHHTKRPTPVPGPGRGTGPALGVHHPAGPAEPGSHRPQHPPEVLVLHAYRHHRRKNSDRGRRQDHARGPRTNENPEPHLLSALDHATGTVLTQQRVADKSARGHALPVLLEHLDPDGAVVASDTIHTQVTPPVNP